MRYNACMRLFLVGDTPLLNRVRIAFEAWFPEGVAERHVSFDHSVLLKQLLEFRPTVVLENIVRGDITTDTRNDPRMFTANAVDGAVVGMMAHSVGANMYHVSDPFVFPGSAPSKDRDIPYASNVYGFSRQLGERSVRALHANVGIIRVGWLYGHDIPESPPMLAQEALTGSRSPVHLYDDLLGSPTYVGDAAAMIAFRIMQSAWDGPFTGTFHLAPNLVTDWYTYLSEDYPVVALPFKNRISEVWHRNAALVPSPKWALPPGGLDRFREDIKNEAWDWTASLIADKF